MAKVVQNSTKNQIKVDLFSMCLQDLTNERKIKQNILTMEKRVERLLKYLSIKGINENQATIICGLSKGLIGKAKTGKVDIGANACAKVLDKFQDLSRVWLLTGEGEMLSPSPQNVIKDVGSVGGSINQTSNGNEVINLRLENERLRATLESYRERIDEQREQIKDLYNLLKTNGN